MLPSHTRPGVLETAGVWPRRQTSGYWAAPPVAQPSAGLGVSQGRCPVAGSRANRVRPP
ncbi:hypothetical protein [Nonomuraea sp. NPDC052265]|uniref:hypothetical protein n=1 Tax=Nonomuraea sp. NPDC052265 TaxID=3364374 RepID=UPI0037C69F16